MNKGELLGRILNRTDQLRKQMNDLFERNNVPILDLKRLPPPDRDRWYKLHKRSHRLGDLMCYVILEK